MEAAAERGAAGISRVPSPGNGDVPFPGPGKARKVKFPSLPSALATNKHPSLVLARDGGPEQAWELGESREKRKIILKALLGASLECQSQIPLSQLE